MELVSIVNGIPVATSAAIAEGTENQHKNVMELIRTYQADLEEFGGVAFEARSFQTPGGRQQREVALLNEQQCTLLLTYMRNNDIVRGFKKRLVHEFFQLRDGAAHKLPQTFAQALMLAAQQAQQIEEQAAQLALAAPAVAFVDKFVEAKSTKCLSDVAKLLGAKPQAFIAKLHSDGVIFKRSGSWVPFQHQIDAGRFTVKTGESGGHAFQQTRVTPAGVAWLANRYQTVEA